MSAHLTSGQRAWLRAELDHRREQLERRLAEQSGGLSRVEHARELLERESDDVPQREGEREYDLAMAERDHAELRVVGAALRRVDDEAFGLCADCGDPIAFDRLRVEPWAMRCVTCEARREKAGLRRAV